MVDRTFKDQINRVAAYIDAFYFGVYTLAALYTMAKVKGRLDFAMWVTLGIYQFTFALGLVETILNFTVAADNDFTLYYLPGAKVSSRFLIWVVNAFFIFVMKDVYNRLTLETPQSYFAQKRKEKIIEHIIYSLVVLLALIVTIYFFAVEGWEPKEADDPK